MWYVRRYISFALYLWLGSTLEFYIYKMKINLSILQLHCLPGKNIVSLSKNQAIITTKRFSHKWILYSTGILIKILLTHSTQNGINFGMVSGRIRSHIPVLRVTQNYTGCWTFPAELGLEPRGPTCWSKAFVKLPGPYKTSKCTEGSYLPK